MFDRWARSRSGEPFPWPTLQFLAALALTFAAPRVALGKCQYCPAVNEPVSIAVNDQESSISVSDGNGGAIIAWNDYRNDTGSGTERDTYAQHVFASGLVDPTWPVNGLAVSTGPGSQDPYAIVSDGAGGAIIVFEDMNNGGPGIGISAQHVKASGILDPAWPANGPSLCMESDFRFVGGACSDGAGGAIVCWEDRRDGAYWDIYAQHVLGSGMVDGSWPVNGRALCTASGDQRAPVITSDGSGGAIVSWEDGRTGSNFDIFAQHVLASGGVDGGWPVNGKALCTAFDDQTYPAIVSDGTGGAIVAWQDARQGPGHVDIYATRVMASGFVIWGLNGFPICAVAGSKSLVAARGICSDGAGGALLVWTDRRNGLNSDIYGQHVLSTGQLDGAWPATGKAVCAFGGDQDFAECVADGSGGMTVTWDDRRNGGRDIYAQRVLANGAIPISWPLAGRAVCTAANDQYLGYSITSDGGGFAIIAWDDYRSGTEWDVYAQRIAPSGYLAQPNPALNSILDIPWDQGGFLKLSWDASYLDTDILDDPTTGGPGTYIVDHYWVLRSAPPNLAGRAALAGREAMSLAQLGTVDAAGAPAEAAEAPRRIVMTSSAAGDIYWEPIQRIEALHLPHYSYVAPTTSDSTAGGNPRTMFMIVAYDNTGTIVLPSDPDSGYSVDNLPPVIPGSFTGVYSAGATHLHWHPNPDPDVAGYRLYRGTAAGFVPGPENLIAAPRDTGYVDAGASGYHYELSAVDIHGNEGGFAALSPSGTTDVGAGSPSELALLRPAPNPARSAAQIGLTLPREARVRLAIYDVAGREERVLADGVLPAGAHSQSWDLRDATGTVVHAGLYFVRLEADGRHFTQRLAVAGH